MQAFSFRSRRSAPKRGTAGFTLVEALVALVVFGVGTLLLYQLAPRATKIRGQGRRLSAATSLAQAKLEELRAVPEASADLGGGTHVDAADLGAFQRRWVVTPDDPIAGMRRVEMRVGFESDGPDSVAVLVTYF